MSGQCWAVLGLCWALYGGSWTFQGEKINPNGKACPLRFILGDLLGLCRPMLGRFGSLLGSCWVIWWAERSLQELLHGSLLGHYGSFHASIQIAEHMVLDPHSIWNPHAREISFILVFQKSYIPRKFQP